MPRHQSPRDPNEEGVDGVGTDAHAVASVPAAVGGGGE
jgi:hypothetical protein